MGGLMMWKVTHLISFSKKQLHVWCLCLVLIYLMNVISKSVRLWIQICSIFVEFITSLEALPRF